MRKTKIICTIGPSSENPEVFRAMCKQGLNVARLNFSHGTHEEHQKKIDMIKSHPGSRFPASSRGGGTTAHSSYYVGFRVSLY